MDDLGYPHGNEIPGCDVLRFDAKDTCGRVRHPSARSGSWGLALGKWEDHGETMGKMINVSQAVVT